MKAIVVYVISLLSFSVLHPACTRPAARQQVPATQAEPTVASPAQSAASERAPQPGSTGQASAGAKVFTGDGIVEGVDRSADTIQINHGDIKGYMPAMSMPYRVKDKAMLDLVKPGDKVTFTIEDTSKGAVVIEIKKT